MTTRRNSESPQDLLWALGASFIDATSATADSVIADALARVAQAVDAMACQIWVVDKSSGETRNLHSWTADGSDGPAKSEFRLDERVAPVVAAGGGIAEIDMVMIVGEEECRERGWESLRATIAVVDETDDETSALVVSTDTDTRPENVADLLRGVVVLLRQLNRRVRAERELQYRLQLEDVMVELSSRFQTVGADTLDASIEAALQEVRSIVDAQSIVMIDVIGDDMIAIPYLVADSPLPSDWRVLQVPDVSGIRGVEATSLRELVVEPHFLDVADIVDALATPETTDAMGLRSPQRSVALLPASISDGESMIAVSRFGDGTWTDQEVDALATVVSLIAQVRARVAAEVASDRHLGNQRALAAAGKAFLEADVDTAPAAIRRALEMVARHLEADLAVIASVSEDREAVEIEVAWSEAADLAVAPGTRLERAATPLIDRLITTTTRLSVMDSGADLAPTLRDSADGRWSTIVAPIHGSGLDSVALTIVWAHGDPGEPEIAQDLVNAMADLIGQLKVRVRAEHDNATRLAKDALLSRIADELLGASLSDADEVHHRVLRSYGEATGAVGLTIRTADPADAVLEHLWTAEPGRGPVVGSSLSVADDSDPVAIEGHAMTLKEEERFEDSLEDLWGPGLAMTLAPIHVAGRVDAVLTAITTADAAAGEAEALRALALMLSQFRSRLREEERAARRLVSQRLLSSCSGELAEATTDDFDEVVQRVLARVGEFCDLAGLVNVWVDRSEQRYVQHLSWFRAPHEHTAYPPRPFGESPTFERVRTSRERIARVEHEPTLERPSFLAVPRGGEAGVDNMLFALCLSGEDWSDATIELIESLSSVIQEVEVRIAAQRYAQAAFDSAPIGVVLRDKDLRLITCNAAFVEFLGAESVQSLVGTVPHDIYDEAIENVDWADVEGELQAEIAFRGPGGSRVWGQMRGAVIEGEHGEHFWLVHIEDITERRRAEQLLRFQASHDELTGLANRRRLLQEIHRIADGAGSVAVLLLDLDRFKIINDSLGHDRGDELLVVIADRLRLAVRPGDLVARLGGDEFAIVLPGPVAVTDAEFVAERMMRLIGEPVTLGRQKVYPTASIGIAVADETTAVDDLLRRADTAMYRAKAQGRARAESFDEELREAVTARMATESGLRGALREDQLIVHYQPEVDLRSGRMLGAEALVRWQHPEEGLLAAGAFIEVAEETGLVVEIGEIVLAAACREAAAWPGGPAAPAIRVNLAAAQIQREDTISLVRAVLNDTGLDPARLCLEITESAVMSDLNRSEEILLRLKNLGVALAVDDFGTGFSSLAYLKRFPVDELKIDRAFVNDLGHEPEDEAFVRSIISLAGALELEVVAEGVETELQSQKLLELGCSRAQGFLFARPGPPDELQSFLTALAG